MQVIKDSCIVEYPWSLLGEETPLGKGNAALSLARYRAEKATLLVRDSAAGRIGIVINCDTSLAEIADELEAISLVVFDCQLYTDGRVFSQVRLLRQQYGYPEDIMVIGDLLQDQLRSLERCGVNVFWPRDSIDLTRVLPALSEITVRYQSS
ncbi:MAG: DUF934 domain-containing protein [Gammaproteobacteria bacterium]|nr:DUF934 domain-containing protein [Gammaproteobacteria bacterium]